MTYMLDHILVKFWVKPGHPNLHFNFNHIPWLDVKEELGKVNWDKMEELSKSCPTSALCEFHENVLKVLEKLVPKKKKKIKNKSKMHRMRRLLWKRHAKASRNFKSSTSIQNVTENLQKMWQLESQLKSDYNATNSMEENEAVLRMKSNPEVFFSFTRSRKNVNAIGWTFPLPCQW